MAARKLGPVGSTRKGRIGQVLKPLDERLRPPVQLADPIPSLDWRQAGTLVAQNVNTRAVSATKTMAIAMSHSLRTTKQA
jgi:hypothetical protein